MFIIISGYNMKYFPKKHLEPSSHTQLTPKFGLTSLCDQNCGVQSVNRHSDRQTHNRKVKTEGHKIMYIDIRYLLTLIMFGGPIISTNSVT